MDKAVGGLQGLGIAALRLVLGWTPIEAGNGRAVGGGQGWRNCRGGEEGGKGIGEKLQAYRTMVEILGEQNGGR